VAIHPVNGLSLCSGVGGLELGVSLALRGYRAVCHVEREAYAASVLVSRMADGSLAQAPIWGDVKTFDGRQWRGVVDIVTAGYPCQPFSISGVRRGESDPRHIWPDIARIIGETRPALIFAENVPGHLSLGFDNVVEDMEGMGYRTAAILATAWALGAPHIRERLFWLATDTAQRVDSRGDWGGGQAPFDSFSGACPADAHGVDLRDKQGGSWWADRTRAPAARDDGAEGHDGRYGESKSWGEAPPPICGMDDGVACRVDRLRATGNGVVPVVAAAAFRQLVRELREATDGKI